MDGYPPPGWQDIFVSLHQAREMVSKAFANILCMLASALVQTRTIAIILLCESGCPHGREWKIDWSDEMEPCLCWPYNFLKTAWTSRGSCRQKPVYSYCSTPIGTSL